MSFESTYLKEAADVSLEIPEDVTDALHEILSPVRDEGDDAVRELTRRFDDVERKELTVSDADLQPPAKRSKTP